MPLTPLRFALLGCLILAACDDAAPPATLVDAGPRLDAALDATGPDAAPDARPPAPDQGALDQGPVGDAAPDATPQCDAPPPAPGAPIGPLPAPATPHRGVDAWEAETWARIRAAAAADPAVHFVATYDHAVDALVIDGPNGARIEAQRVDGRWTVIAGALADVFPSTDPARHGTLDALLAAFEPYPDGREALGYAADDPRVGGLPVAAQAWPHPLERLGTLFDAPHAPDGLIGLWPWARGGVGTHGGLGLLQSRATLILAGKGARVGVLDDPARLVDVAPTVLAALGAPTTDGVGATGAHADGLYLKRQDGRVLWEALAADPCERPKHVVIALFDGLMANEINHQVLSAAPDVDLPTLRALAAEGAVYRFGAVAGFPSMSAPGHMTIGTGAWPGHHGIVNNQFFDRAHQDRVQPLAFASDPAAFAMDPASAFAFHDAYVPASVETLAAAAHRAWGPWDAEAGTGAYVAVINDIPVGDADFTTADYLMGARSKALSTSRIADDFAVIQVANLLGTPGAPVPTILQIGFASTDSAGESDGPHAPLVRTVLTEMDARLGRVVASYERAGALDDTLFVLVSDHGMALQDPARAGGFRRVLTAADAQVSDASFGVIYLKTLEVVVERAGDAVGVLVRDHDDGRPVEGATVTCAGCMPAQTGADGRVEVATTDGLRVTHPAFNPGRPIE